MSHQEIAAVAWRSFAMTVNTNCVNLHYIEYIADLYAKTLGEISRLRSK